MDLANQWGRDTVLQPRRGSAGPIIVVAILSLAIGLAGGYAAFLYIQPVFVAEQDISAQPPEADPETARLTEALAQASRDLEAARTSEAARAAEVEDLKAQTARQAADLDAMAEKLAEMSSGARPTVIGTAAAVEALTRERNALAADNQTLATELAAAEADRDTKIKEAAAEVSRLEGELADLSGRIVPDLTAERDRLQRQAAQLLEDQAALSAQLKAAEQANREDGRRIAALETRLGDTEHQLAAAQAALAVRRTEPAGTPAAAETGSGADATSGTADAAAPIRDAPAPRDADEVAAALKSAPGVAALSAAERRRLEEQLTSGECVTSALKSVFDRVPILTLRNLIRDLNSDC